VQKRILAISMSGSQIRELRVLVFPCATGIGLEIHEALKACKNIILFGASSHAVEPDHGPLVYARFFGGLPKMKEPGALSALKQIVQEHNIDFLFPGFDDAIVFLAEHRSSLPCVVLAPSLFACDATRSKATTYKLLAQTDVMLPDVYDIDALLSGSVLHERWPIFMKPAKGQGSQGTAVVGSVVELAAHAKSISDPVACEYLPGKEYTVDCFSTKRNELLFCRARERARVRSGISVCTVSVDLSDVLMARLRTFATTISKVFQLWGAWFFQVKLRLDGTPVLMEVAPRIAGAMALHRQHGVNFPLLTVYEAAGFPVTILTNDVRAVPKLMDKAYVNRYPRSLSFQTVYVDWDDTIVLRNKLNLDMIRFLYQCVNENVKLILITRSKLSTPDLLAELKARKVASLFDDVIHVTAKENKKSSYICSKEAIFIDDSFSERLDVGTTCGIPTFDSSMIEMLLDWRA